MHLLNKTLLLFLLLFISGCASISPPEGGEKDIKSPELVSSTPANQSLNVKGKSITLQFNEEVRIKDFNRQLIISPNAENNIEAEVDRDEIRLTFEKDFEPNTTYYLNFREGIEDITEGNKPKNLSLTFSTGAFLDSGQVQGNVTDLLTGVSVKDINVILYAANDTATIRNAKPYYLTKTEEDGSYLLQNIKYGTYLLYAHQDKNNDNIYNDENEKIGYLASPITITAQTPTQDLQLIRIDTKAPYITSKQSYINEYHLNYNEGITAVKIAGGNPNDLVSLISENAKTARLFPSSNQMKGTYFVSGIDSTGNTKTDTVDLAFTGKKAKRNPSFQVLNNNTNVKPNEFIQLKFDAPLQIKEGPLLTLVEDSITNKVLNYPQDIKLNESRNILSFNLNTKAKSAVEVIADTSVILPISGDRFKRQQLKFSITNKDQGGSLDLKIQTSYKKYFLELLDKDYKIVKSFATPKTLLIEELNPNTYRIRVKIDEDENGEWRAGNKDLKTMPEKVYNYLKPIEVRVNWSQEIPIEF